MLYVFLVDTGTMKTFNMNLTLETVSCLQNEIAQSCQVAESDQVLLISGGESLDPNIRVCTYNAGTDTNPIFLFNKAAIESTEASPQVYDQVTDGGLLDLVRSAMDLPVAYSTVVSRTELSQKCYNAAIDIQSSCEQLCHEQHLQQQSWAAVVANLDDITNAFKTRSEIFNSNFNEYLKSRDKNIKLLQNFNEDLSLLSKIPLLPVLVENESGLSASAEESLKEKQSLLQWISSKDNQSSVEQVADQCRRGLEQFDLKTYESLQTRINESIQTAANNEVKEIKGLQIRLYRLDEFMHEAKDLVKRQGGITQSFMKNCRSASEMKEDSVLPDLCATHREQLQIIIHHHQQLLDIQNRCKLAKKELTTNMHTRLKWIMYIEVTISDIDNRLVIYHENLKRLKRHLDIIYQIHLAPQIYFELITEVVLRRKFSEGFLTWAKDLAGKSSEMLNEELKRRRKINQRVSSHFLISLFPGLEDLPPSFANEEPVPFDIKLPKIEESDLHQLQTEFPEHKSQLNVPFDIAMHSLINTTTEGDKSVPVNNQEKSFLDTSKECYISTSDRTTWTFSTSPPEPAPSYQTNEKMSGEKQKNFIPDPEQANKCEEASNEAKTPEKQVSTASPSTCVTSYEGTSGSPELGEFLTADFYIDESMPSSYTESNGVVATSKATASGINVSLVETEPKHEDLEKKLNEYNIQINNLKDLLIAKDTSLKKRIDVINERAMKSDDTNLNLKKEFSSVKESVLLDMKNFSSYFKEVSTNICELILNQQNLVDSEKISLISDTKAKLQTENDAIIAEMVHKLKLNEQTLMEAEECKKKMAFEIEVLKSSVSEMNSKLSKLNTELLEEKDNLMKQLMLEHELELETIKQKSADELKQICTETASEKVALQNEILKLKDELSETFKNMELEKKEARETLCNELKKKHEENVNSLMKQHENDMQKMVTEIKNENQKMVEDKILELKIKLEQEKTEVLDSASKSFENEKEMAVQEIIAKCNADKETALMEMQEELNVDHRNEIESLRSRFKLAVQTSSVMEKSISDTSLEKIEMIKDSIERSDHEEIITKLKEAFEKEKFQLIDETTKKIEEKHASDLKEIQVKLQKEKIDAIAPLKTSMMAEKQILFNEAVSKVTAEKDQIIKELKLKVKKMTRMIEQMSLKENQLSDVPEAATEDETTSGEQGGARPKTIDSTMSSSVMTLCSAQSEENESIHDLRTKLQFKQEQLDVMRKKFMELSVTSSTESLIHADKVSVLSCNIGEVVLLFFDEKYSNYAVFLLSPVLHFLHAECYESLGLDPSLKTKKMWALAEIVDKEYCQARKVQNRYKVEVGTKFYRVKAVPWSKEVMLRKEHRLRALLSASSNSDKTGSL